MKSWGEVKNRKEFKQLWFEFATVEDDEYRAIFLNNRIVMQVRPEGFHFQSGGVYKEDDFSDFLNFSIGKMQEIIGMVKDGTYNDFVNENLDFRLRTGTVLRSDCWKVFPNFRNSDFECITDSDRKDFIEKMKDVNDDVKPQGRLKEMTAALFYECCALGYNLCGLGDAI